MIDLNDQIRAYFDEIDPPFAAHDLMVEPLAGESLPAKLHDSAIRGRMRGPAVALAMAVLATLAIAAPLMLLKGDDEPRPPAGRPTPPTTIQAVPLEVPEPVVSTPDVVVEEPTTGPTSTEGRPGPPQIDYGSVGAPVGQSDTPLGLLEWLRATRVPVDWIEAGFPVPGHQTSRALIEIYGDPEGPCSGLHENDPMPCAFEVYEVPGGYLGFGAGAATRTTAWSYATGDLRKWNAPWYSWVFVTEVWFSADGETWELMARDPFDSGAAVMHDPFVVATHDGRWVVIGWVDVPDDDRYMDSVFFWREPVPASSIPAAWTSDDLRHWTRLDADFGKEGSHTMLTSVAAGEHGWVIGGVRKTVDSPIRGEWVLWASEDGLSWDQLETAEILGEVECKPTPKFFCNRLKVEMSDDAIVTYGWEWDPPVEDLVSPKRWTLWIGVLPDL